MISVRDLEWAAGFIEGEGHFACGPNVSARIAAGQVNLEPLERLLKLFGGSLQHRTCNRHPITYWVANDSRAVGIMMTLYSLLSERRQGQIRKVLDRWRSRGPHNRYKTHCINGHEYTEENTYRRPGGGRKCRICVRDRALRSK